MYDINSHNSLNLYIIFYKASIDTSFYFLDKIEAREKTETCRPELADPGKIHQSKFL